MLFTVDESDVIKDKFKSGIIDGIILSFVAVLGYSIKKYYFDAKTQDKKAKMLLSRLGYKDIISSLNKYEMLISSQLVDPAVIDVTFDDIAGLDNVVNSIKTNIILPLLTYPVLKKKSVFFQPPRGVLLYGPPGCGKTMIAKATAKEAKARFLNLAIPTLTDKWYGESQKYSLAVFTLAQKLRPCIIFIDEIDTFLRSRGENDHEVTAMMKAQFMILWDGLNSRKDESGVIVLGATNRPQDVDEAILRRMPSRFEIRRPDRAQRIEILKLLLENECLDSDVNFEKLAELSDGFSASDLKELCRSAISAPLREEGPRILNLVSNANENGLSNVLDNLRKVNGGDFLVALEGMKSEGKSCQHEHSCRHSIE